MAFENMTYYINDLVSNISVSNAANALQPVVLFLIGMVVYSIFVFKFYKFISRKDIFRLSKGGDHSKLKKIAYALEYIFLFPIITFFWFLVMSSLLAMLSEVVSIDNIFMISIVTIATIRITAYYNEDLSRDVAKLIPFALLAIFLIDISEMSVEVAMNIISQVPASVDILIYYFVFILLLEIILRLIFHGRPRLTLRETKEEAEEDEYLDLEERKKK